MKPTFLLPFALAPLTVFAPAACVSDGIALDCTTRESSECASSTLSLWTGDATTTTSIDNGGTGTASTTNSDQTGDSTSSAETVSTLEESSSGESSQECVLFAATHVSGCANVLGEQHCAEGGMHIGPDVPATWTTNPPHSGMHAPVWAEWGVHEDIVSPRNWVHNLEHGGIILLYSCPDGCENEIQILEDAVAQRPELRVLLTGYPELTGTRFAAVSWSWIYRLETPDLAAILCFIDQHEGHAPEDVAKRTSAPLGSCSL